MVVAKLFLLLAVSVAAEQESRLLCFGASWCQPCREMQPALDRLAGEGYPIHKVDVDSAKQLVERFGIDSVPSFVLIDQHGRKLDQIKQATDENTLRRLFAHYRISPNRTTIRGQSPGGVAVPTAIGPADSPNSSARAAAMASTVRIKVEDQNGHSFGTGTVVDIHGQEALVLTCGHIFRDSDGKGRILIERFDSQTAEPSTGSLISFDIDRDVALLSMKLTRPIKAAPLAPLQYQANPGEAVFSIGCNRGANPTLLEGRVNQIDKYLGPPNITASGRPVVGRSGGGLFNAEGQLIGVCSAADPEIDEGLYAALPRVYYELDRNGLSFVYQKQTGTPQSLANLASKDGIPNLQPPREAPVTVAAAAPPFNATSGSFAPRVATTTVVDSPDRRQPSGGSEYITGPTGTSTSKQLVCILKSEDGSEGKAYVIENPSKLLLDYLQREASP